MSKSTTATRGPQHRHPRPRPRCPVCNGQLVRWHKSHICIGCPLPVRVVGPAPARTEAA